MCHDRCVTNVCRVDSTDVRLCVMTVVVGTVPAHCPGRVPAASLHRSWLVHRTYQRVETLADIPWTVADTSVPSAATRASVARLVVGGMSC